jgi:Ca2+-binding RTX toxin-like protein
VSFVLDGSNFTYGSSGDGTSIAGGTLTSFHEFSANGTALADFTGLAVDAVTWMNDVKLAHAGNTGPIDAVTSTFAYHFTGGSGNDTFGSAGHADTLIGGAGDDTLDPGGAPAGGHDTVTGGSGSDTIVYQAGYGALSITDFDQGNNPAVFNPNEADHIQLNGLTAPLSVSYTNGNAILDFGNNDIVTLLHVSQSQYEALGGSEFAGVFSADTTTTINLDDAPVIAVDNLNVTRNDDGTTTVSGLSVTDADATSSEIFTIAATTAGAASGTSVSPASGSGHLADINTTLESGVTYDQGGNPPSTDMVTLTVAEAHGAADTVNLIFNVADNPVTPVTLAGTTGKDVFFGTGHQDQFVFAAHSNHDTIMNFTHGQDHIDLSAVVTSDASSWFSQNVAASPTNAADTLVTIDSADTIVLHNVLASNLSANDFILHPGGSA